MSRYHHLGWIVGFSLLSASMAGALELEAGATQKLPAELSAVATKVASPVMADDVARHKEFIVPEFVRALSAFFIMILIWAKM